MPVRENTLNVVLFGASVSAQSKNDSYWKKLKLWEGRHNLSNDTLVNISRLTFPSAYFSSAGLLSLSNLIAMKPDVVILDWLSTEEQECSAEIINFVIQKLVKKGVSVLTTAMVRLDTWERITQQYCSFLRCSSLAGQPFIDFVQLTKNHGLTWEDVTRDGVHTNETGADLYSKYLIEYINSVMRAESYSSVVREEAHEKLSENDIAAYSQSISTFNLYEEITIDSEITMEITIYSSDYSTAQIWAPQVVGPETEDVVWNVFQKGILKLEGEAPLKDEWCHFYRQAYKPVVEYLDGVEPGISFIKVSVKKLHENSEVRILDKLDCINCSVIKFELVKKHA